MPALVKARHLLRTFRHALIDESRHGRDAEIAAWSNAAAALVLGAGAFAWWHRWMPAGVVALGAFVLLRLALSRRTTVWIASLFGTVSVSSIAGALGWLFGHVVDIALAPVLAGAACAVLAGILPLRSYLKFARARARNVRDSLFAPPSSGDSQGSPSGPRSG